MVKLGNRNKIIRVKIIKKVVGYGNLIVVPHYFSRQCQNESMESMTLIY